MISVFKLGSFYVFFDEKNLIGNYCSDNLSTEFLWNLSIFLPNSNYTFFDEELRKEYNFCEIYVFR